MESTYPNPRPQHPSLPSAPPHHPSLRMAVTQPTPSSSHTSQDGQPAGRHQTLHHSEHGHLVLSSPMYELPSMDGWWECCQDEFENNPALSAQFCGKCRHKKCSGCKKCSNQGFHTAAVSHRCSQNCRPTYPLLNPNQAVHGYVSTRTSTQRYIYPHPTTTTRCAKKDGVLKNGWYLILLVRHGLECIIRKVQTRRQKEGTPELEQI